MKVGTAFGPYRIERPLGRGGMAETFVASRDLGVGASQIVCLKRMLPGLLADSELVRAFEAEAGLAAGLVHANIAALIDYGIVEDTHYLALELVDGVDLRILLREAARRTERLPSDLVAEIAYALGHALDYAHAISREGKLLGVVHRDISPSNVLVGRHGQVKLADFGIAKAAGASHHTKTGMLKGKIPYMPPEYIVGGAYEARGDLFALGVTLFECVTGRRPFDGARDVDTLHRITEGERPSIRELAPDVPEPLANAIESLLAVDPNARPRHARAFLAMLDGVAPPASTRARLADAVTRLVETHAPPAEASGERTEQRTASLGPVDRDVVPASSNDVTRTRARPDDT